MANKNIGKNKKGLDAVSDASKVKKIKTKVQKEELIDDEREDNISSSKKDKVLKKGKNKEKNDGYEIISEDSFDMRVLHILRTAIVILVIFLVFGPGNMLSRFSIFLFLLELTKLKFFKI